MHQTIFNDDQNVHTSSIQKSIRNSIEEITKSKPDIDYDVMIDEIMNDSELDPSTKEILRVSMNSTEILSILEISYKELLLYVWDIIRKHNEKKEIIKIMNEEIKDSDSKCFVGKISRLLNCVNGFDCRIKININDSDQIGNLIILIKSRLNS